MSQFNLLDLCRLCLDKDRVSIPIFEGEGLVKKLFMKIGACLPVKVSESDRLPKKICDDCIYKVELVYSFWNTTANAEKQLLALLGEADSEPQVPLLDDSVKTENEVGMSVRMEESNISSNKSLPGQAVSKIALTNPTVIGGNVSSLSACMEMTNSTGSRLGNDLSNQSREDDSDEEESDVDDDATYSEEEDDPAAIGDGESSFNTVEPTFVNVDHMGDEAGPSGLQHEMEVENMEGEMPVEPSAAQPDELSRSRKRRTLQRRRRLDEVPNAASTDCLDVSASSVMENPAFGIVCVDVDCDSVDASNQYPPCSLADPLCVNIKLDPDCQQEFPTNTSAVNHTTESSRVLCAENALQLQSEDDASCPLVVQGDLSFQSSVESDPLQLNDIKVSVERMDRGVDVQPPSSRTTSKHHVTEVSADFPQRGESPEISLAVQAGKSLRRGTTENDEKSFACMVCSFKASTNIDLGKHLLLHQVEKSTRNATQSLDSKGHLTLSSVSSSLCTSPATPRECSTPLFATLDEENSVPEYRPRSSFQNTRSLHMPLLMSFLSPNSDSPTALSSPKSSETSKGQFMSVQSDQKTHPGPVEDIEDSPNLPGQSVTSSLSTCHDAVSVSPLSIPITDCLNNATNIPSPPALYSPSRSAVNGEGAIFYSLPNSQDNAKHVRSVLGSSVLKGLVDTGISNKEVSNPQMSQLAPRSINYSPDIRQHPVGSLGMASGIHPTPLQSQRQVDVTVTSGGSIKGTPVLCQSSAVISKGLEPPPLFVFPTFPLDRSNQILGDTLEEVPPNLFTPTSPLPSRQLSSAVPRKISVIQQPSRKSVSHPFPVQSSPHLINPSNSPSALQSDVDIPNKASDLSVMPHPLDHSAEKSSEMTPFNWATSSDLEPICSTNSLKGPSAVQSSTSSHPVSKNPVQVIDNKSEESRKMSHPPGSSRELASYVQSYSLNLERSASSVQTQLYTNSEAPLLPVSTNTPQLSMVSRIDHLIETHAHVLNRTQAVPKPHPFNVANRSATSRNTLSFPRSKQSTRELVGRHLKSSDSTASVSHSNIRAKSILRHNAVSSGDVPHEKNDRGDCILLDKSVDLTSGFKRADESIAMNVAGPHKSMFHHEAKSTKSTYALRAIPRKSPRTRTPFGERNYSSSDSGDSNVDDPEYFPPLRADSDGDSDNPDDCNSVSSVITETPNRIPSSPLASKLAVCTSNQEDVGITKSVSSVSIACPIIPPSTCGVACARTASKGDKVHLNSTYSSEQCDGAKVDLTKLVRTSERTSPPCLSAALEALFSLESTDPSISRSLQVISAECSSKATRTGTVNPAVAASAENLCASSVLTSRTFPNSLLLDNACGSAMPIISDGANSTACTSARVPHESSSSNISTSTGMKANSSNSDKLADNTNTFLDSTSEPAMLTRLLCGSTNQDSEISTATTSREDSNPTNLEMTKPNSNCKEPQHSCRDAYEIITGSSKSNDSPHSKECYDSAHSALGTYLSVPAANNIEELQAKTTLTIPELVSTEKSSICSNKGVYIGKAPCTAVRSNGIPQPDELGQSRGNPVKPQQVSQVVIDIASDDSSVDDDLYPERPRRKRSSGCSSSESDDMTMVDPDYIPPSREKLPLKTPDSVLDEIPTYEHWVRSKFIQEDSDTDTPRPDNACCVCLRKFPSHESFKKHRAERYRDLKCCKCAFKASTEKTLKTHTNKHWKTKPYTCQECKQTFSKRGLYVKHFLMHRNDFYYMCNICDQGFNDYTPYENHINKHLNQTPYKCLKCDLAFTAKALLQSHKKRMHKRNAFSECPVCKKNINKFWLPGHLKRHEQKELRTFLCELCGRDFKSKLSLSRHILQHTGERPHMCKYCGATFKVPGALKQHERKHTGERPFKCDVCGKTFAFNTPYTYHLRTHTGERPYTCPYCGMTFAQPSPFAVHKRLHTGERPYTCKICDAAFASHAAVRNHMQTHANSGNAQKRTRKHQSKEPKPKKGRSTSVVDKSSSSDSEKEITDAVVKPRRRSGRQTKCTKSLVEKGSDSEENRD